MHDTEEKTDAIIDVFTRFVTRTVPHRMRAR